MSEKDEKERRRDNFIKYISNPRSFAIKKWMVEILQSDYHLYDDIIERISYALVTEEDVRKFGSLISKIYEKAYVRAVKDYAAEAQKLGIKVKIGKKTSN